MPPKTTLPPPFGPATLPEGVSRWVLGPLELRIERIGPELRVFALSTRDASRRPPAVEIPYLGEPIPDPPTRLRFGFAQAPQQIELRPALADRPTFIRPETPFWVLPGQAVEVLVSSPLWVQIHLPGLGLMTELPTLRPSDTWFGRDTRQGELGYALATPLRLHLDPTLRPPGRAFTQVTVQNGGETPMNLSRLRLPARQLSLWADPGGHLYTESVTLRRTEGGDAGVDHVLLGEGPPEDLGAPERVAGPRNVPSRSFALRAIESVFG